MKKNSKRRQEATTTNLKQIRYKKENLILDLYPNKSEVIPKINGL